MRPCLPLLLLATGCLATRPPPPPPPEPRFSLAAGQQHDPEMCRRMAEWDCLGLDCSDCAAVAQSARTRDVAEPLAALGALGFASSVGHEAGPSPRGNTPFADALHSGSELIPAMGGWPAMRAESAVESCRVVCRSCATAKEQCDRSSTPHE